MAGLRGRRQGWTDRVGATPVGRGRTKTRAYRLIGVRAGRTCLHGRGPTKNGKDLRLVSTWRCLIGSPPLRERQGPQTSTGTTLFFPPLRIPGSTLPARSDRISVSDSPPPARTRRPRVAWFACRRAYFDRSSAKNRWVSQSMRFQTRWPSLSHFCSVFRFHVLQNFWIMFLIRVEGIVRPFFFFFGYACDAFLLPVGFPLRIRMIASYTILFLQIVFPKFTASFLWMSCGLMGWAICDPMQKKARELWF